MTYRRGYRSGPSGGRRAPTRKTLTQRSAEAFGEWPDRPPVVVQGSAELAPASASEAFAFAVDTVISAWAYWRTSEARDDRRDGLELFAAAMDGLCEARQRYRDAADDALAELVATLPRMPQ